MPRTSTTILDVKSSQRSRDLPDTSNVPLLVSNRRTDDYWCSSSLKPNRPTPDWILNPEDYRCRKCRRFCSDSFLLEGQCGYCRGEY